MIDVESYVYTQCRAALLSAFQSVDVSGDYEETPAAFPHVCIEMGSTTVSPNFMTAQNREFASDITFTVNIYTNSSTPKTDAKTIANVVDGTFTELGFRRAFYNRTPNMDRNIYRLTLRYDGLVSQAYDGELQHYNVTAT